MPSIVDVNTINPFLTSAVSVIETVAQIKSTIGKPSIKSLEFTTNSVLIILGVTGELKGHVIFELKEDNTKRLASKMMMDYAITTLDDMALSAISELGNMIMGNAATVFSTNKKRIDITPPSIARGNVAFSQKNVNICVPLLDESQNVLLNINISVEAK